MLSKWDKSITISAFNTNIIKYQQGNNRDEIKQNIIEY